MKHDIRADGKNFGIRPIELFDAAFVVSLRTDPERSRYINSTSSLLTDQVNWLEEYFQREGDWYFVIERLRDSQPCGLVAIYDFDACARTAEWGRWIIKRGALAATESALLTFCVAFEVLNLSEINSRTVAANKNALAFHDASGASRRQVLIDYVSINGTSHDSVEHVITRSEWPDVANRLSWCMR